MFVIWGVEVELPPWFGWQKQSLQALESFLEQVASEPTFAVTATCSSLSAASRGSADTLAAPAVGSRPSVPCLYFRRTLLNLQA